MNAYYYCYYYNPKKMSYIIINWVFITNFFFVVFLLFNHIVLYWFFFFFFFMSFCFPHSSWFSGWATCFQYIPITWYYCIRSVILKKSRDYNRNFLIYTIFFFLTIFCIIKEFALFFPYNLSCVLFFPRWKRFVAEKSPFFLCLL